MSKTSLTSLLVNPDFMRECGYMFDGFQEFRCPMIFYPWFPTKQQSGDPCGKRFIISEYLDDFISETTLDNEEDFFDELVNIRQHSKKRDLLKLFRDEQQLDLLEQLWSVP